MASCATDDESLGLDDYNNASAQNGGGENGTSVSLGELTSFIVALDVTDLSEAETIDETDEDYIENNTFGSTIGISFSGESAEVSGEVEGVSIEIDGADVVVTSTVKGVNYVLSGSTGEGMFKVYSEKKYQLTLNGVSITNSDGPAINLQSGKRAYVVLTEGTVNTLKDGTSYVESEEDQKGTFFSEGELLFSGSGHLRVFSNTKNGIVSDDYIKFRPGNNIYVCSTSGHGIKADGDIFVNEGDIMVRATGDKGSEGVESKSTITVNGGQMAVYSYDDAINSKSHLYLKGGNVFAWAMNNDGIDANGNLYVQGGTTVAYGSSSPECGIDANEEGGCHVIISDGTLVAVGGGTSYPYSTGTQPAIVYGGNASSGTTLALSNNDADILAFTVQRSYNGTACFLFTAPTLSKDSAYTITSGATASGNDWYGLKTAASITSKGSSVATVSSLASPYSTCGSSIGGMGGGGMGGGGMPSGGNFR